MAPWGQGSAAKKGLVYAAIWHRHYSGIRRDSVRTIGCRSPWLYAPRVRSNLEVGSADCVFALERAGRLWRSVANYRAGARGSDGGRSVDRLFGLVQPAGDAS